MLKKIYRLPAGQKLKNSSFFKSSLFTLRISKNNMANNRYAFVVKKSLDKRAVYRNRVRRLFRSCTEELVDDIKGGYDMLFVLEKGIMGKERSEMFTEIKKLLKDKKLLD